MVETKALILAVDDEPDICRLMKRVLESAGYQVITTTDSNQVLELVAQRNPDLVLLDILMPGKSGMEVFQELKRSHPDVGVIMVTAVGDANVAIETLREGAYDYLLKPFNVNELVISVTGALEKRRLVLENRDYRLNLEKKVTEQTQILQQKIRELTGLNNL
ncbi:MAG: response regulator, partial [Chloroflexi bacterium]|nr:response regulator [Chloroflexota bacterium]